MPQTADEIPTPARSRVNRPRYLVWIMGAYVAVQVLYIAPILGLLGLLALPIVYTVFSVHRLHDIGLSGWWVLILGLPVINLYLMAKAGEKTENAYGPPPPPSTTGDKISAGIVTAIALATMGLQAVYINDVYISYQTRGAIHAGFWEPNPASESIEFIQFTRSRQGRIVMHDESTIDFSYDEYRTDIWLEFLIDDQQAVMELEYDPDSNTLRQIGEEQLVFEFRVYD